MTTNSSERSERTPQAYGERPGLTVDSGAVNADGVDMSGFMAVLHDAGTDECGNVTVSSGLWSRIKCEHYTALAEAARLRAALERIEAYLAPMPAEGNMAAAVAFGMVRAALKRAEGERRPEGARATEAGKDGAR